MFGKKVQIAALEKQLPIDVKMVPFTDDHRYQPKHPDVMRINPKGQVPALIHGAVEIFDSTQIFEYFEDICPTPALWPKGTEARARARLLELKSDEVFFPHIIKLMGLQPAIEEPAAKSAREAALAYYDEMERELRDSSYLAGGYSYADIAFYTAQIFAERLGAPMSNSTPHLFAWRERMTIRPAVAEVMQPFVTYLKAHGRRVPDFLSSALSRARALNDR